MLPFIFFNQLIWVLGTLIGLLLGGELIELIPNLDFALTALFIILAYEQYSSNQQAWPIYMAIAVFAIMHLLFPSYALDRKSTRLKSSYVASYYAVFCLIHILNQ